ncbi:MAG TPA: hypothetical protein VFZ16_16330 [Hyphomicrobiaceae bacterium]|nr:hypothetical protein [Hyphomicrobiaceae bacterium]
MRADAQLEAAFAKLGGEYRARKEASERVVCAWQWATFSMFDVRPLHFEQNGIKPGRPLRRKPSTRHNFVAYGLDRERRVVVERDHNEHGFYETFYEWTTDSVEAAHFDYYAEQTSSGRGVGKKAINLLRASMTNGRIVASDMAAAQGYTREEYRWEGGLVREVWVLHAVRRDGVRPPLRPSHTTRAHYDEDGVLKCVDRVWPAADVGRLEDLVEIMFERRGKTIYWNRP